VIDQIAIGLCGVTAEYLRQAFDYNPETGQLIRKIARCKTDLGPVMGSAHGKGYLLVSVLGRPYLYHRLVWLHVHGEWPKYQLDHIDGNKKNNRIENLRDVDGCINQQNMRTARKHNSTGILGVTPNGVGFRARITHNGTVIHLGTFESPELASAAYAEAKRRLHG
jgi:hypothetical protein